MSDEVRSPRSPLIRILTSLVWIVGAVVVLLVLAHVFVRPVAPEQQSPPGHFGEPCIACHLVSDSAQIIDHGE